ncbi:MAG TPA: condensation domain-containing protein [Thermoanaerobaculia bacterium]|nr:condensation domain-containing protein [Thermoanaerobaculia bacterium]
MRNVEDVYPLTPLQQSLLSHALSSRSMAGFEQKTIALRGLDLQAFVETWQRVVDRHPILRTAFVWEGLPQAVQVVRQSLKLPVRHLDWRESSCEQQRERLAAFWRSDREEGFDPAKAPLMRLTLVRTGEDSHQLVWSYHHLLLDAWSRGLVLKEVSETYAALAAGREPELPQGPPFRDYISWLQQQDLAAAEAFWRTWLHGFRQPTPLPIARSRGRREETEPRSLHRETAFTGPESDRLRAVARQRQLTLSTLFHGAWTLLLARYTGREDVTFGTTVSGRPADLPAADSILGMFVNNLPVRLGVRWQAPAASWLREVQDALAEIRHYEHTSPAQVQEWSEVPGGQRLFESLVVFQNVPLPDLIEERPAATGLQVESYSARIETGYPFSLFVSAAHPLGVSAYYYAERFDASSVLRLLGHLRVLLLGLAERPDSRLEALPLLTEPERQQLLVEPGAQARHDGEGLLVHQLVEAWVARTPAAAAVLFQGTETSFLELGDRADALARRLQDLGLGPEMAVAVCLEKPPDLAVALVGILKTGAAYVLLDPRWAPEVQEQVVAQAGARLIVGDPAVRTHFGVHGVRPLGLEETDGEPAGPGRPPRSVVLADNLACVAYPATPSAGVPAVELPHRALAWRLRVLARALIGTGGEQAQALCDPSAGPQVMSLELLLCLASGSTARYAAPEGGKPVLLQGRNGLRQGASHLERPMAAARLLWPAGPLCRGQVDSWLAQGAEVWTLYGPDEVAGCALLGRVRTAGDTPFAGRPPEGAAVVLLDRLLGPVPLGIPGELHVLGNTLARGYRGRPDLTAERFVPSPCGAGERAWRAGELARLSPTGDVELLGAVRPGAGGLEEGEIEAALRLHPLVAEVAVTTAADPSGGRRRIAYVSPVSGVVPEAAELHRFLRQTLPEALIPSAFAFLEELPRSPDGRVDRRSLPPPHDPRARLETSYVAPRTPLELRLVRLWEDLFGFRPIGVTDGFFEIGGQSLLALRLVAVLQREFGRDLPIVALLQHSTVERLAAILAARAEPLRRDESPLVALQPRGTRSPLFCVHPGGGGVLCYVPLAYHLGGDQPCFGLQARGWDDGRRPRESVAEMAESYLEALRGVRPRGPYHLAGWSFGGVVAFEMAHRLRAAGEEVGLLAMLDAGMDPQRSDLDDTELLLRYLGDVTAGLPAGELRRQGGLDEQIAFLVATAERLQVLPADFDLRRTRQLFALKRASFRAGFSYEARPYAGRVTVLRAEDGLGRHFADPALGWSAFAGEVEVLPVPGTHEDLLSSPYVETLAERLRGCLDREEKSPRARLPGPRSRSRGASPAAPGGAARGGYS